MFENYSLADLFANIYKKLKLNILIGSVLFLLLSIPIIYQYSKVSEVTVTSNSNFSSYIVYKINDKNNELVKSDSRVGGYTDFYQKLLNSNINGAFLFNDISEEQLDKYAGELGSGSSALINSDITFWAKKIYVNPIEENKAIAVQILTSSKNFNIFAENKLDKLITEYSKVYDGISVEKLPTVYSTDSKESHTISSRSLKQLVLNLIIVFVLTSISVILINFLMYIFNPTINRTGDYNKYKEIDKVFDIDSDKEIEIIRNYYGKDNMLITTSDRICKKLKSKDYKVVNVNSLEELEKYNNYIFVEEYGLTRYRDIEKLIQKLNNFEKNILGVISYKL